MSKFTPGPWRVANRAGKGYGKQFDVMTPKGFAFVGDQLNPSGTSIGEARANAELAATAPDLLDELRKCIRLIDGEVPASAIAVIAKATGEKP